ncbi:hypothetical protein EMIT0P100_120119 [Pseudomonas sp. IT-P100]
MPSLIYMRISSDKVYHLNKYIYCSDVLCGSFYRRLQLRYLPFCLRIEKHESCPYFMNEERLHKKSVFLGVTQ